MERLYRFSPIENEDRLLEAVTYISKQSTLLCSNITNESFPISSLTVFSHYPAEFEKLTRIVMKLGDITTENNGPFVKLHSPIELPKNKLEYLRIRKPDPYRMHVGCNDFEVDDYEQFKKRHLHHSENLRLIKRDDYEMIEFFHPDFDVLAYILSKQII